MAHDPALLGRESRTVGERQWPYVLLAVLVIGAVGAAAYSVSRRDAPPTWSSLPETWFRRPVRSDPQGWNGLSAPAPPTIAVTIEGAAVAVHVIPEDRTDIAASFAKPTDAAAFELTRAAGGGLAIGSRRKGSGCGALGRPSPAVTLRVPMATIIRAAGPVKGDVGPAAELMLVGKGCGAWTLAGASGRLWLAQDGTGVIQAGTADEVRAQATDGGRIRLARAARSLDVMVRGDGAVTVGAVVGQLDAEVRGTGEVRVVSGFTGRAQVFVQGGSIVHGGDVGGLVADATRGGKVRIRRVLGAAEGSGDVAFARQ